MFLMIPIILSTKVLWSDHPQTSSSAQDLNKNEYYSDDNYPKDYNYDDYTNLELHDAGDNYDQIHMRGFGSNREQDENEYSYPYKKDDWELVE